MRWSAMSKIEALYRSTQHMIVPRVLVEHLPTRTAFFNIDDLKRHDGTVHQFPWPLTPKQLNTLFQDVRTMKQLQTNWSQLSQKTEDVCYQAWLNHIEKDIPSAEYLPEIQSMRKSMHTHLTREMTLHILPALRLYIGVHSPSGSEWKNIARIVFDDELPQPPLTPQQHYVPSGPERYINYETGRTQHGTLYNREQFMKFTLLRWSATKFYNELIESAMDPSCPAFPEMVGR